MNVNRFPLVTIVIPTFNHSEYLIESIDSVLSQTYPNVELIVLDDGSTDNTIDLLKKYGDRIYWQSHKNMGQANTLNKGWSIAKGEILGYLSADDVLKPDAVKNSIDYLNQHPDVVVCYCDFDLIDPNSKIIRKVNAPEYDYKDMLTKLICPPGPGTFFRKSVFKHLGGWNTSLKRFPDYEYWLRVGLLGKFGHLSENLAAFRVHENSQSFSKVDYDRAEEVVRVIEDYFELNVIPYELVSLKQKAISNATFVASQIHLRSGRYRVGLSRFVDAFCINPKSLFSIRVIKMLLNGFFNQVLHKSIWRIRDCFNNLTSKKI